MESANSEPEHRTVVERGWAHVNEYFPLEKVAVPSMALGTDHITDLHPERRLKRQTVAYKYFATKRHKTTAPCDVCCRRGKSRNFWVNKGRSGCGNPGISPWGQVEPSRSSGGGEEQRNCQDNCSDLQDLLYHHSHQFGLEMWNSWGWMKEQGRQSESPQEEWGSSTPASWNTLKLTLVMNLLTS